MDHVALEVRLPRGALATVLTACLGDHHTRRARCGFACAARGRRGCPRTKHPHLVRSRRRGAGRGDDPGLDHAGVMVRAEVREILAPRAAWCPRERTHAPTVQAEPCAKKGVAAAAACARRESFAEVECSHVLWITLSEEQRKVRGRGRGRTRAVVAVMLASRTFNELTPRGPCVLAGGDRAWVQYVLLGRGG